jgi:CheY-like chemotaxis protein
MMPNFFDMLQVYLVPFAIAVPIGLLLIFFGTRRNRDDDANEDIPIPQRSAPVTPVDVPLGETTQFKVDTAGHGVSVSPGGGIDLPLSDSVRTGTGAPATAAPAAPMTILVVDDSAVPRTKLRKLFEGHGYVVHTADDGVHAMEAINKIKFNVIVTDLEMPNMDGFELIAAIQGSLETEDIPVIAITGHEEMQARVHNIQGLYGIFKKPWNDRELLKRVDVLSTIRK